MITMLVFLYIFVLSDLELLPFDGRITLPLTSA